MQKIKRAAIIYKRDCELAKDLAAVMAAWLKEKIADVVPAEAGEENAWADAPVDLAITLGGDGTILGVARRLAGSGTPIFGVNFGNVGFLTSADPEDWRPRLEDVLAGRTKPRPSAIIRWELWRDNAPNHKGVAINDIVISRYRLARLVNLRVTLNGVDMGLTRGDGALVHTPLGSAGYNASAGGCLVHPSLRVLGVTPLNPYAPDILPLIVPAETEIELSPAQNSAPTYLTIDGQYGFKLENGDLARARGEADAALFYADDRHFYQRTRDRAVTKKLD